MRNEQSKTTVGLSGRTAARSKEKFNWKNVAANTEGVYSSSAALKNLKQLKPTPSIATSHFAMTQAKIAASPPRRAKQWATSGIGGVRRQPNARD
jgi:hypothetical protein